MKKLKKLKKKVKISINIRTLMDEEDQIYEHFEKKARAIADLVLDKNPQKILEKKESQIKSIW